MKRFLLSVVLATTVTLTSCEFDDSDIWDKFGEMEESIHDHEQRISALEELCKQMNTNIEALQTLVNALEKRDYVTNVSEVRSNGEVIGYTISFAYSDTITIYHGQEGKDGANGADGKDGYTPQIGVMEDTDGIYYWTLDGEWLLDAKGNKIKAVGTDGADGKDGQDGTNGSDGKDGQDGTNGNDGKDGVTPQLKIENDYWYVSYDNGATWVQLGKATGEDGKDGANGADGKDGYTPQIGVMEDTDGIYYWTLDGEWLLDGKGNKIQANGVNGTNGTNGVTPQLKIENDYWYVSYDNGATWVQLGKATGEDGKDGQDSFIIGVEESETEVVFILSNNTTITIPKHAKSSLADPDDICTAMDDVKFMEYCYQNFDVNKDGKVSPVEAKSVRSIDISNLKVYSIKGVEYFEILETFIAKNTLLRNVDLSFNSKLISFSLDRCSSLTSVTIPGSITWIGDYAFRGCTSLTSITIPDSVTDIGSYAFSDCDSLTSVTIPDSVTSIGSYAFRYCDSLTSVNIGNCVTSIGEEAFYSCDSLTSVYITDIAAWCKISFGGTTSNPLCYAGNIYLNNELVTDLIIPDSVTSIVDGAFRGCTSLTSVTIGNGVTSIGDVAFRGCTSLTSVTIPDSVTSIGESAFYNCTSLTSVTIGNGVTTIGSSAFYGCTGELIVNCNIPSATGSNNRAFYGADFTKVSIGDSVTEIGSYAFSDCDSLTSVTIPDSVTSIGNSAFEDCDSLTSVTIPDSVTSIGNGAFSSCDSLTSVYITDIAAWCKISFGGTTSNPLCYAGNLYLNNELVTDLIIPDSVTSIVDGAFRGCTSLTSVTIGNGVTSIGDVAFYDCTSLTSITIPDSVTTIGSSAFDGCTSLTSITIPDSVTTIGGEAFYGCTSLTSVYITDIAAWCKISFDGTRSNPLYYAGNLYLNNELVTDLIIPDSVTSIGEEAFYNCDSLTSVTIPDSVTSIGNSAFEDCSSLTSVTIGNGVTEIGRWAFDDCTSLTSVTIGKGVTSIEYYAFRGCTSLTSITIPDSVNEIGEYAFRGCTSLTSVTIGNCVTKIGEDAFRDCTSLMEVYCKPITPPMGDYLMFNGNASGRTIYVPSNSVSAYKSADYWSSYSDNIFGYNF